MALFKINGPIVKKIISKDLDLEKNLQFLFEQNLEEILNIYFLAHEYSTSFGGRIDTVGIDRNGSPCIIEYKKSQNENIINQGLSYLKWLLDHKEKLEILCQNKKIGIEIDWDSPRVICIAESYNKFDLDTADLLPINIELLKYRVYENDILLIEPENQQKIRISKSKIFEKKEKNEIKTRKQYTINDHLRTANQNIKEIFEIIKEKIFAIDESIIEEAKAKYIAYKLTTNFVDIVILKDSLKIFLNVPSDKLDDPYNIARDLAKPKKIGHWGNGDYEVRLEKEDDIDAVFELIKQSYNFNK